MGGRCIRPTPEELEDFGTPDFTIYNAGQFPCNRYTHYMTSSTSIDLNLKRKEMVILGTQYAGEMKKGLFSVMHYLMPKRGILSLHSGCNMGKAGDVALFFGLSGIVGKRTRSFCAWTVKTVHPMGRNHELVTNWSVGLAGTGKTTLSTDENRYLIGDDEHCWSENGVSNIEGGCYAKCIDLSSEKEPEIWNAIKFGTGKFFISTGKWRLFTVYLASCCSREGDHSVVTNGYLFSLHRRRRYICCFLIAFSVILCYVGVLSWILNHAACLWQWWRMLFLRSTRERLITQTNLSQVTYLSVNRLPFW